MAKMKGPKKTNRYPDEFKIKAVQLADHPDILAKDVAEDLGIHHENQGTRSQAASILLVNFSPVQTVGPLLETLEKGNS